MRRDRCLSITYNINLRDEAKTHSPLLVIDRETISDYSVSTSNNQLIYYHQNNDLEQTRGVIQETKTKSHN